MKGTGSGISRWATGLLLALALPCAAAEPVERYVGHLLDTGGTLPSRSSTFLTLRLEAFTPVEKMRELAAILKEKGPEGLDEALAELDAGYVRIGEGLGHRVALARSIETPNGRLIRIVTDRPVTFAERRRGARSQDYTLGILELMVDAEGKGEGQLIAAAKVDFDEEGRLEVSSVGREPLRVLNVHREE